MALEVKNPPANAGDMKNQQQDEGSISGLRRSPGEGQSNSLQYSCLENPHGEKSLEGYSPWGRKASDTNEHNCYSISGPLKYLDFHIF